MSSLDTLQSGFQDYLLNPRSVDLIEHAVIGDRKASAELRLGIYADAYRMRLEEALGNDYEALHGLLGDGQFHRLCLAYIDAHPSRHFSLRYFGQHMAPFLKQNEPYAQQPILSELAAFEWSLLDAFDAADSAVLTIDDMAALPHEVWPAMSFIAHASVRRLDLNWNVTQMWSALKEGNPPEPPLKAAMPWVIWRHEYQTYFRSLAPQEAWALNAMRAGQNFAELCEGVCQWVEEEQAAVTAAGFLHRWVRDGLIISVNLADSPV